jgi:hypothetical protein
MQVIVHSLTCESIGRLHRTWAGVSPARVAEIQLIINLLSKLELSSLFQLTSQQVPLVPDIDIIYQEMMTHCTSGGRKPKVNFREARGIIKFLEECGRLAFEIESKPQISQLLGDIEPLPDEMLRQLSCSHENEVNGKSQTIEMRIHGLYCQIGHGALSVTKGKTEDLLDLLLDPNLFMFVVGCHVTRVTDFL